ncbi:MAG: Smr/MutS family protein [Candidatus Sumerlaeia bacterium]|nr:Smr/MutS family protein [Candidatus Sumerlaeia bacterium]
MERSCPAVLGRLGFDRVLESVAAHCASELGRRHVLALEPSREVDEIEARCGLLDELWRLAEGQAVLPLAGLRDLRDVLGRVRPADAVLEPEELQAVAGLARLIDRVAEFLGRHAEEAPRLAAHLQGLHPCPGLHREIDRCLTPSGDVADAASPRLGGLRRDRRRLESSIRTELDRMLRDAGIAALLQDSYTTQRHGRHVVPLAANHRGKLPGIVHDRSATGETLFVEPMAVVELTNDATEARLAEEAEVRRVLGDLTALARESLTGLDESLSTLGSLDALAAIADWGRRHRLSLTRREPGEPLRLLRAHHPLLWLHHHDSSVPFDLVLGPDDRAVVISGPNAGGKTTALKTLGLLQLMTQAGLPVPADADSNVPVPRDVHVDIGDDQDIMAGRSTFSAHVEAIARICDTAQSADLVLLDELGTATDPQEGGALAVAVLEALAGRGCLVVATSHLALLKHWAHETACAQNASVTLDARTQRPTYRLELGLPGPSEALTVAGQVGLRGDVLTRARALVPEQEARLGELIRDLQEEKRSLETLREDAGKLRTRLEEAERSHRETAAQLERERRAFRRELAVERRRLLAEAKADVERRIADLPGKRELLEAKRDLEAGLRAADSDIAAAAMAPEQGGGEFAVGDAVLILDARERGRILSIDPSREQARVETSKGMLVTVRLSRLGPAPIAPKTEAAGVRGPARRDLSMELNLIGQRVEPALEALDKFLDEAVAHGLTSIRVVHGHGTGRLRTAVREYVAGHPLAARWRPAEFSAGGHGVTIVELR